jgi:hypothetical protein
MRIAHLELRQADLADAAVLEHQDDRVVVAVVDHVRHGLLRQHVVRQVLRLDLQDGPALLAERDFQELAGFGQHEGLVPDLVEHHAVHVVCVFQRTSHSTLRAAHGLQDDVSHN